VNGIPDTTGLTTAGAAITYAETGIARNISQPLEEK
jgi:hypothetical protein